MAKDEKPKYGWLVGLYYGLGLRPFTAFLSWFFSGPVAFALAVLIMNLVSYPLFLRGPRYWSWQRNWGFWHFAVFDVLMAIGAYFLARAYFPDG